MIEQDMDFLRKKGLFGFFGNAQKAIWNELHKIHCWEKIMSAKLIERKIERNLSGQKRRDILRFDDGSLIEKNWLINERTNIIYFIDKNKKGFALAWSCYEKGSLLDKDEIWLFEVGNSCISEKICLVFRGKNVDIEDVMRKIK